MEGEQGRPPPVREHSRPQPVVVTDLNQAWRQELWYLDTLVALPFRGVRRLLARTAAPWGRSLDEAVWALEGLARLPVKVLQAMAGEPLAGLRDMPGDGSS
ncbi:MAG: hypothetical protein OWV35_07100 [Firmicutes bacterium]|nr:hypothetical protein [Bacillota bacterium]